MKARLEMRDQSVQEARLEMRDQSVQDESEGGDARSECTR